MQFSKQVLIDKAKAAIKQHRADYDASVAAWEKAVIKYRADWIKEYLPRYKKALKLIQAEIDSSGIVSHDNQGLADIRYNISPLQDNGTTLTSRYNYRKNPGEYTPPSTLLNTIELLESVIGDTIGSSVLSVNDIKRLMGTR